MAAAGRVATAWAMTTVQQLIQHTAAARVTSVAGSGGKTGTEKSRQGDRRVKEGTRGEECDGGGRKGRVEAREE